MVSECADVEKVVREGMWNDVCRIADVGLRMTDCGCRIAEFGLRMLDCEY